MLSQTPTTRSKPTRALKKRTGFRAGRSGACEARLFRFTGQTHGESEPPVKQVAACDLQEAMTYMRNRHADFDILHVGFVA
jgi:hypothetical protein